MRHHLKWLANKVITILSSMSVNIYFIEGLDLKVFHMNCSISIIKNRKKILVFRQFRFSAVLLTEIWAQDQYCMCNTAEDPHLVFRT